MTAVSVEKPTIKRKVLDQAAANVSQAIHTRRGMFGVRPVTIRTKGTQILPQKSGPPRKRCWSRRRAFECPGCDSSDLRNPASPQTANGFHNGYGRKVFRGSGAFLHARFCHALAAEATTVDRSTSQLLFRGGGSPEQRSEIDPPQQRVVSAARSLRRVAD